MPEEWRSELVPIFKDRGDGIKLMSHIMKICDRGVKARLSREVTISER